MYIGGRRPHTAAEADLLRQEAMEWQMVELIDDIDGHCLMTGTSLHENDTLLLPPLPSSALENIDDDESHSFIPLLDRLLPNE